MKNISCNEIISNVQDNELRELFLDIEMKNKIDQIINSIFNFTEFNFLIIESNKKSKQKKYIQLKKMNSNKPQFKSPEYDGLCGMRAGYYDDNNDDYNDSMDWSNSYDGLESTDGMCKTSSTTRRRAAAKGVATKRARGELKSAARKAVATKRREGTFPRAAAKMLKTKMERGEITGRKMEAHGYDGMCAKRKSSRSRSPARKSPRSKSRTSLDRSKRMKEMWKKGGKLRVRQERLSASRGRGRYDGMMETDGMCATKKKSPKRKSPARKSARRSPARKSTSAAEAKREFQSNPRVNPETGRKISAESRTYRNLAVKFGVDPLNALSTRSKNMMGGGTPKRRKSSRRKVARL